MNFPASSYFKNGRQMAILFCSGLLYPTGWEAQPSEDISQRFFSRAENPPEDITLRLFLMNMIGLKARSTGIRMERNARLQYVKMFKS
jgi:hypothetical protein